MAKERSSAVKGVIAVIVIALAVIGIIAFQRTRRSNAPRPTRVITINVETGQIVEVIHQPGDKFPLISPGTGENTLYQAFVDKDGKYLFPGHGIVTMSPTGSKNVATVSYGEEEYLKYPVKMDFFRP